jgi:hypothetical protein
VVNLRVQGYTNPTSVTFGNTVEILTNVSNITIIQNVTANISYNNITSGKITEVYEIKLLTFRQNFSETEQQYNLTYSPPRSGNYNINITVNATRILTNTTSFNVSFGQPYVNFTFPNYRVMINQTFNVTINVSATNGDIWYTNLSLNMTNKSIINITSTENFYYSNLYNLSNGSSALVNWNVSSRDIGLTTLIINAVPVNGTYVQSTEPHKVINPILLASPNTTNITLNTTLRTKIVGNTSRINGVNLTISKAYLSNDSATAVFSQTMTEIGCTGEASEGGRRVALDTEGAYSTTAGGNRTIDNDYGNSWAGSGNLIIFLNSSYTIERFSIYWKNVTGSGNVTIYYNTSSGWVTVSSLSALTPPISEDFTNISAFTPFTTNAFNISHTDIGTQIFEFAAYEIQPRTDLCYVYDFNFSNTSRSGNYNFNATIRTTDSIFMNSNFSVNFGNPIISISSLDVLLTPNNYSYTVNVLASNGDLRNLSLNLTINDTSVLNISSNDTQNKTVPEILNTNTNSTIWTITAKTQGSVNTNVSVNSTTSMGSFSSSSKIINVTADPGTYPNVTNFWFNYSNITTNKTNLYTNLTIYANVSDDVGISSVIANITYPNGNSTNVEMSRYSSGTWEIWNYAFDNDLHLNSTGNYTVRITTTDIGNQNKSSGTDFGSPENMTFTVYDNYTLNLTSNYTTYMRGENVTIQALDVNNIIANNVSWIVNVTKINQTYNFTSQQTEFNYTVQLDDQEGNYSIIVNASRYNNTGNYSWNFNVSRIFSITDVSVTSLNPSPSSILNVQAYLNNARSNRHTPSVNGNLFCYDTSNASQYQIFVFNFTSGFSQLLGYCISPSDYSTSFNITINVSDQYNNSDQYIINLTTTSYQSTIVSSGGGGSTTITPTITPTKNCTDGTLYNKCSSNRPYYCSNGTLISKCSECKCESGYSCQTNEICTLAKAEDFNFTIDTSHVEIEQGKDSEIKGNLLNTGNTILNLLSFLNVSNDCCNVSIPLDFKLNEKEEKEFTVSIHVSLLTNVSNYQIKIGVGTQYVKKEKIIDVMVLKSPYYDYLSEMDSTLKNLEKEIQGYKNVGINTGNLEKVIEQSKLVLSNASSSISSDQINVLSSSVSELKSNINSINSSLSTLIMQKFLAQYSWLIILLVVSIILNLYFIPEVLIPLQKIENKIRKLKDEEKVLVSSRVETEKQYFMRKIDENTFSKMMITKQDNILKLRASINENEKERTNILTRTHPKEIIKWFGKSIKNLPKNIKNLLIKAISKIKKPNLNQIIKVFKRKK